MRRGDLLSWALACGATPEVAAEVEAASWTGVAQGVAHDPYLVALVSCAEGARDRGLSPERRRWCEMAALTMLAAWSVRP